MFSAEHSPSISLRQAVRMSMSIPLFFQSLKANINIYVDGGVSWNYAINIFDHKKYNPAEGNYEVVNYNTNPDYVFNHETLGFRLDSKSVIDFAKNNWAIPPESVSNIKQYAMALVNFMSEMANKTHLHTNDWNRTVFIDIGQIQTTQFNLSTDEINDLVQHGKNYTAKYFEWEKRMGN